MLCRLTFIILLFLLSPIGQAHDAFSGELKVLVNEDNMSMELNLSAVTAEVFTQDIVGRNNQISPENLNNILPHLTKKAMGFFDVRLDNTPLRATNVDIKIISEQDAVVFTFNYPQKIHGMLGIKSTYIKQTNPEYKLTVTVLDQYGTQLGLFIHSVSQHYDKISVDSNASKPNSDGVFSSFLVLGVEHILIGFDHLVFLLALLLICRNWKDAAIIITCFTIAHSITLSLASLQLISIPSKWVELAIALTIVYVGLENLYCKHRPKHRWVLTSCFGLIHGLGFANVLMGLGLGTEGAPIFLPLLAFNLGVEIGQLSLSILLLPVLWYLLKYKAYEKIVMPIISVIISGFGLLWIVERIN